MIAPTHYIQRARHDAQERRCWNDFLDQAETREARAFILHQYHALRALAGEAQAMGAQDAPR